MDKDLRKIVKALEDQGFEVTVTKRGHVVVTRDGQMIATFSGTASDWRSIPQRPGLPETGRVPVAAEAVTGPEGGKQSKCLPPSGGPVHHPSPPAPGEAR